jgi:hypothetical protein
MGIEARAPRKVPAFRTRLWDAVKGSLFNGALMLLLSCFVGSLIPSEAEWFEVLSVLALFSLPGGIAWLQKHHSAWRSSLPDTARGMVLPYLVVAACPVLIGLVGIALTSGWAVAHSIALPLAAVSVGTIGPIIAAGAVVIYDQAKGRSRTAR